MSKVQRFEVIPTETKIEMPHFTTVLSACIEHSMLVFYALTDSPSYTNEKWTECRFQLFKTGESCIRVSAITDPSYAFVGTVNLDGEVLHLFIDHNFTDKKAYV